MCQASVLVGRSALRKGGRRSFTCGIAMIRVIAAATASATATPGADSETPEAPTMRGNAAASPTMV